MSFPFTRNTIKTYLHLIIMPLQRLPQFRHTRNHIAPFPHLPPQLFVLFHQYLRVHLVFPFEQGRTLLPRLRLGRIQPRLQRRQLGVEIEQVRCLTAIVLCTASNLFRDRVEAAKNARLYRTQGAAFAIGVSRIVSGIREVIAELRAGPEVMRWVAHVRWRRWCCWGRRHDGVVLATKETVL